MSMRRSHKVTRISGTHTVLMTHGSRGRARYFRHLQADWSKGPAMVTGELTGLVLALDVSVPCP